MTAGMRADPVVVEVPTPGGPARVHVRRPRGARGTVLLGHGAGGGLRSVDLTAAVSLLDAEGWATGLVEQPWLVAGRRVAGPPPTLDAAWVPLVQVLRVRGGALATVRGPLVLGGRSAGARVACRTAEVLGADAVLCLSFPLHLPGYADRPDKSRAPELRLVTDAGRPIAAVQGETDAFGTAAELAAYLPDGAVYPVTGTHSIPRGSAAAVAAAVLHFTAPLRDRPSANISPRDDLLTDICDIRRKRSSRADLATGRGTHPSAREWVAAVLALTPTCSCSPSPPSAARSARGPVPARPSRPRD